MKIVFVILLALIAIGVVANSYLRDEKPAQQSNNSQSDLPPVPTDQKPQVKTYTLEEVAALGYDPENHTVCWTVIHDKVYDITKFVETHPGGESVYEACGKDATFQFETREIGSGTPHSSNARSILEQYYIGDLRK